MWTRHPWLVSPAALLVALAALLLPSGAVADGSAPIAAAQSAQRHYFALFRGKPEGLPGTFRAARATMRRRGEGLNPALAQHARPNRDQPALWAIPGRGMICIYVTPGDQRPARLACRPTADVAASGLELHYSGAPRGSSIFGVVPDGVDAVEVEGNAEPLPVIENALAGRGRGLRHLIHRRFHDKIVHPPVLCPRALGPAAAAGRYDPEVVCRAGAAAGLPSPRLVSRADGPHGKPSAVASEASIDPSGRFVAFFSAELDHRPAGIYVRDLRSERNRYLGPAGRAYLSSGGGGLLLYSRGNDSFVRDLATGARTRFPRAAGGFGKAAVSADGRFLSFASSAGGPPRGPGGEPGERLPYAQVYLCERAKRHCEQISRASGAAGAVGGGDSREPSISATGRYVAFASEASDLVPEGGGSSQIYLRDRATSRTTLVSRWPGSPRRASASRPSLSADGRYVAFERHFFGHRPDVVVRDLWSGRVWSPLAFTRQPIEIGSSADPVLSPDGRFLAFRGGSLAYGWETKLFLADLRTHHARFVHLVGSDSGPAGFSRHGRYLVFDTHFVSIPGRESEEPIREGGKAYRYRNPFLNGAGR